MTDDLERLLRQSRWPELLDALDRLDAAGLRSARAWYRETGWASTRPIDEAHIFDESRTAAARGAALVLAVVLANTPADAVKRCDWRRRFGRACPPDLVPELVARLAARGRGWCAEFLRLADGVRVAESSEYATEIAVLSLPLIAAFDLPVPEGESYALGWTDLQSLARRGASRRQGAHAPVELLPDGTARFVPGAMGSLRHFLEATPKVHDTLVRVFRTPDLLWRLGGTLWDRETGRSRPDPDWPVPPALEELLAAEVLSWDELFVALVDTLPRHHDASLSVGVALLKKLAPVPGRLQGTLPFVINAMPVLPGKATAALLPAVLAAQLDDVLLRDLAGTVLARPEKAQKAVLLKHLGSRPKGDAVADELLALAAASDDSAFAEKARTALAKRAPSGQGAPASVTHVVPPQLRSVPIGWTAPSGAGDPVPYRAPAFRPVEHSPSGIVRWYEQALHAPGPATQARLLDVVAELGAGHVAALRRVVRSLPDHEWYHPWGYQELKHWGDTGRAVPFQGQRRSPWSTLDHGLVTEVLTGIGTRTFLLSTPTRQDGVLEWDDLTARLRRLASDRALGKVGEWDLARALLRLELPSHERVTDRLGELEAARGGPRMRGVDLVDVVSGWVRSGGLPGRVVRPQPYRVLGLAETAAWHALRRQPAPPGAAAQIAEPETPWPVPGQGYRSRDVRGFAAPAVDPGAMLGALAWADPAIRTAVAGLAGPLPSAGNMIGRAPQPHVMVMGVSPFALEVLAASCVDTPPGPELTSIWRRSAGPWGVAAHHCLAQLLVAPDQAVRAEGASLVAELASRRVLDAGLLEQRCLELLACGEFSLVRAASSVEQVVLAGAGGAVWPSLAGVLQAACTSSGPKPAGLADLLRMAGRYVATAQGHLPERAVPPGMRALAAATGTSKAAAEARAYCAAADANEADAPDEERA